MPAAKLDLTRTGVIESAIMRMMTAGQRLRILRTLEGWSQAHVAHLLGLAAQTLSFAEADRSGMLSQRMWEELATIFGVHLEWLMSQQGPAFVPDLRVYRIPKPDVQRTWRMIAEGLTSLGKPFLDAIGTRGVFRLWPGLAVLRLAHGWALIDAPAFTKSLDDAFSGVQEVDECSENMRFQAIFSGNSPQGVFESMARHLRLSDNKVKALVQSWELWIGERDRGFRGKGIEDALRQITELVSRYEIPIEQITDHLRSKLPRHRY